MMIEGFDVMMVTLDLTVHGEEAWSGETVMMWCVDIVTWWSSDEVSDVLKSTSDNVVWLGSDVNQW